jgi:hypothetical protein
MTYAIEMDYDLSGQGRKAQQSHSEKSSRTHSFTPRATYKFSDERRELPLTTAKELSSSP